MCNNLKIAGNAIFHIATSAKGWLIMAVNMAASSVSRKV